MYKIILNLLLLFWFSSASAQDLLVEQNLPQIVPRTIIALYDSNQYASAKLSKIHLIAEMPLNHLGYRVEHYDINKTLPNIANRNDVVGVITWFSNGVDEPLKLLSWLNEAVDNDKKIVIMGYFGFTSNRNNVVTSPVLVNRFLKKIGIKDLGQLIDLTYDLRYSFIDSKMMEYERKFNDITFPFQRVEKIDENAKSYLRINVNNKYQSDLVVISDKGAYVGENYTYNHDKEGSLNKRDWYLNPFLFFKTAFEADELPKPDVTTLAGRRIYYSHIDGDGWNNVTQLEEYRNKKILSSQVIMDKAIKPFSDLPISVSIIAAEIDPLWVGTDQSVKIAKEIFELPQVEVASHTYSHPFSWQFFADENPDKEKQYLKLYKTGNWEVKKHDSAVISFLQDRLHKKISSSVAESYSDDYKVPRAYANEKFSIDKEINGAIEKINKLAPAGKEVKIVMWSGNTSPFEKALKLTRLAGVANINGGDTRFDPDYPSIGFVSPIGYKLGNEYQVYASASNENTYTDLWTAKFHGFKYLINTVKKTETPIRLKPFNIYYHMYSGEKEASLNAVISNLSYARTQNIIPITASNYSNIAQGFDKVQLKKITANSWQILNRGKLQTIRFDDAIFKKLDMQNSFGVIGQKHYQSSLYVYLDENVSEPIIAIDKFNEFYKTPTSPLPYLIDSRWRVWNLEHNKNNFTFKASGFGNMQMKWWVVQDGKYKITINNKTIVNVSTQNNILNINIPSTNLDDVKVKIEFL